MERRLTERGAARKRQLMAFAAARFAEHGYHPTSVAEIVKGLGVGKGVFYWYFSSKEELFLEILRDAQHDLRRRQKAAIEGMEDPIERIEHGIRASMHWSAEHRDLANLFSFAATEERFAFSLRKGQEIAVADAARHVKDAIAEGRVPDADPVMLAHAILGVTKEYATTFIHERGEAASSVADAAVEFCLGGLLGRRDIDSS